MNSYQQKQLKLIEVIEEKFKKGESPSTVVAPVKDYANDNRICLTSIAFISPDLERKIIESIIKPLQVIDNSQYYYVPGSFHLTIQNVKTINDPPLFNEEDVKKAKAVFERVIPKHKSFDFEIKRLFDLPTSLSICGFCGEELRDLVFELREELKKEGIPDNKRYASSNVIFGNVTISRYTSKPSIAFLEKIKELKETVIGVAPIKTISLITTNSVCLPNKTQIIGEYNLRCYL